MPDVTKVQIINKGLTLIGASPITSIDDDSENARIANRVYNLSLRSVLSECMWNFAVKRALLSLTTNELDWYETGESYVYSKPPDHVRTFAINYRKAQWREEGEYIISDTANLGIRYVWFIETPSKYSSEFIDALIDKFASDAAYAIVNSATAAEKFLDKYEKLSKPKAMSINSQTGIQQLPIDDAWLNAKYSDTHAEA